MRVCECRSVGMYLCAQPFQCVLCVGIAEHKAAAVAATFVCISIMHSMRDILFSFVGHIQRVCLSSRLPPFFYPFKFSGIAEIRSEKYRQYYGYSTTLCTTQSIWAMVWWWVLLLVMVFTFFFIIPCRVTSVNHRVIINLLPPHASQYREHTWNGLDIVTANAYEREN